MCYQSESDGRPYFSSCAEKGAVKRKIVVVVVLVVLVVSVRLPKAGWKNKNEGGRRLASDLRATHPRPASDLPKYSSRFAQNASFASAVSLGVHFFFVLCANPNCSSRFAQNGTFGEGRKFVCAVFLRKKQAKIFSVLGTECFFLVR